jgi:phosphatidylserine/phosphatidylglycerophosphate/cardiolipin synthase-like enzyme
VVITGGRNIADEYFDYDHEYNFRDRDILLIGNECKAVKNSFEDFWNHELSVEVSSVVKDKSSTESEDKTYHLLHEYACNPENFWPQVRTRIENLPNTFHEITKSGQLLWLDSVSFISDIPGKNSATSGLGGGGATTSALLELVQSAQKSVIIQTPYLITTELSQNLFKKAINRGVEIKILTNSLASTDNVEAFSSYQKDRETLLKLGVQIYEMKPDAAIRKKLMTGELQAGLDFQPTFGLHAKSMVIDDYTTVIGTFNLDPRSANLNTECIVIVKNEQLADGVLKGMNEEFKPENAWKITLDFNPDSEVGNYKRLKTWTRKVLPKGIL